MLQSFIEYVSAMDVEDLQDWLVTGLLATRAPAPYAKSPAIAFQRARLSFGQEGDQRTDVDELVDLYEHLSSPAKLRFHQALARAIDLQPITVTSRPDEFNNDREGAPNTQTDPLRVLDALIELGLDTQCNLAIDALIGKLVIPEPDARREVFLHAAFYLDERDAPSAVLRLAKAMLNSGDYPDEIAARLLVALCRYDVEESANYAEAVLESLRAQLDSLRSHPHGYEEFRSDLADAIRQVPAKSRVVERMLAIPLLTELLRGKLQGVAPNRVEARNGTKTKRWEVSLGVLCAAAFRWLFSLDEPVSVADSIRDIDQHLATIDAVATARAGG